MCTIHVVHASLCCLLNLLYVAIYVYTLERGTRHVRTITNRVLPDDRAVLITINDYDVCVFWVGAHIFTRYV